MPKGILIICAAAVLLGSPAAACDLEGGFGRYSPFYGIAHKAPAQQQVIVDPSVTEVFAKIAQSDQNQDVVSQSAVAQKEKGVSVRSPQPENVAVPKDKAAGKPAKSL